MRLASFHSPAKWQPRLAVHGHVPQQQEVVTSGEIFGGALLRSLTTGLSYLSPRAQELCESRGGRPGLPSLISLRFLKDVKQHFNILPLPSQGMVGLKV